MQSDDELDEVTPENILDRINEFDRLLRQTWPTVLPRPTVLHDLNHDLNLRLVDFGVYMQEPKAIESCGESAQQQLASSMVLFLQTMLKIPLNLSEQHLSLVQTSISNAMYVIWCSVANPDDADVRRQHQRHYLQAGLVPVALNVLNDSGAVGYDVLMGHHVRYNCCCVLWNLSRQPEHRVVLLRAGAHDSTTWLIITMSNTDYGLQQVHTDWVSANRSGWNHCPFTARRGGAWTPIKAGG